MLVTETKFSVEELLSSQATRWDRRIAADLAAELESQLVEKADTIPEMRRLLAVKGYRELRARLQLEIGDAKGDEAIRAMAFAMRAFAHERPGLSAATFRNPMTDSPEWRREGELLIGVALRVFESAGLKGEQAVNAIQILRALVRGFPPWNEDDIEKFERRWPRGTRERVLFDIYQFTGLRRGDASVVGKQHVRKGIISIRTEKTGMLVTIPILPELQKTLDAGPLGELSWFARLDGRPMVKESVGSFFAEACKMAGIYGKSGHGVRKAAATQAAENEATTAQMNSIFGWEGDAMASLYTKSANRTKIAAKAINKLSRNKK
jgi:integrase